jgi:hypothetical protein
MVVHKSFTCIIEREWNTIGSAGRVHHNLVPMDIKIAWEQGCDAPCQQSLLLFAHSLWSCLIFNSGKNYCKYTFTARHFLIPWTGGAFSPLGPFPPLRKKWPIAPKPGPYELYWVNEFNIEKKFKNKICWWVYLNLCCIWMFSMQFITNFTIKTLFWEVEILLNAFSECRKCYFRDPNFKNVLGGMPGPDPPCYLVPAVLGSHLRRSHTILGEGQGKWALWQFCPTTEESLKNALYCSMG